MGKLRVNPEHLPHFPLVTKFAGQLRGKTVIVKVDWNATLKSGVIKNPEKIAVAYPTIQYVLGQGGNVILLSHLGRPEKGYEDKFSLAPVHQHVAAQFADYGVEFAGPLLPLALGKSLTTDEYVNEGIYTLAKKLGIGSNARLLLLENVRFAEAEQKKPGEPGYEELAKALLSLSNGIVIHEAAAV
jgi:phosphoglycerate kinase